MRVPSRTSRSAFTMVEILVVLVIIGILAGLVIPRLFNSGDRQASLESQAVAALLTAAAQRDSLSSQPLALAFDPERNRLSLEVLSTGEEGDAAAEWIPAPLIPPVILTSAELREALSDGHAVAASKEASSAAKSAVWRIELGQAQQRPTITLVLGHGEDRAWQLDLLPGELAARRREIPATSGPVTPDTRSEDLDATGRREQPW
ncbi:MAG: type II secretion system protein [Phycisphaerales bacterium]